LSQKTQKKYQSHVGISGLNVRFEGKEIEGQIKVAGKWLNVWRCFSKDDPV